MFHIWSLIAAIVEFILSDPSDHVENIIVLNIISHRLCICFLFRNFPRSLNKDKLFIKLFKKDEMLLTINVGGKLVLHNWSSFPFKVSNSSWKFIEAILKFRINGCSRGYAFNGNFIRATTNSEETIFTPIRSPTVFDNPIFHPSLAINTVAYRKNGVVCCFKWVKPVF